MFCSFCKDWHHQRCFRVVGVFHQSALPTFSSASPSDLSHFFVARLRIKSMYRQSRQWMPLCSTLLLMCIAIPLVSLVLPVGAEASESVPDDATLLKMKVKDLKAILQKKGPDAACLACTSKQEYVSRIHETKDWPDVTAAPEPTPMGDTPTMEDLQRMFSESQNDERIADLKKKLQEAGLDTSKIFTASGMNRDEILKEKEKFENVQDEMSTEGGDDETKSDL